MEHLDDAQLNSLVFDGVALADDGRLHLQGCVTCQQALQAIQFMASELTVARRSVLSPAAQQRYASLFAHVQRQPSLLQQLWQAVRATLTWDSRQQPVFQGVRGAAMTYRLLYETPQAAIELMVEAGQELRHLEGEVALEAGETAVTPLLVQLVAPDGALPHVTMTDDFGRFYLDDVTPGAYHLLLTLADGTLLVVQDLEIS